MLLQTQNANRVKNLVDNRESYERKSGVYLMYGKAPGKRNLKKTNFITKPIYLVNHWITQPLKPGTENNQMIRNQ